MSNRLISIISLLVFIILISCDDSSINFQPDTNPSIVESSFGEATLGDDTTILPDETLEKITQVSSDGRTYTFNGKDSSLDNLRSGQIVVMGISDATPNGALRRIERISRNDEIVTIQTVDTSIEEAFHELDLVYNEFLEPSQVEKIIFEAPGQDIREIYTRDSNPKMLDLSFNLPINHVFYEDESDPDMKIQLDGSLKMKPKTDFSLKVGFGSIRNLRMVIENEIENNLILSAGLSQSLKNERIIYSYMFGAIAFGPVVVTPVLEVKVRIEGQASVGISTSTRLVAEANGGVEYSNNTWNPVSEFSTDYSAEMPGIDANASIAAYIGPQINLLLYGVAGPYVNFEGYGDVSIDLLREPELQIHAGVDANAGVRMKIFSLIKASYEVPDLYSKRVLVFERSLSGLPGVNTSNVSSISYYSAVGGGQITNTGSTIITDRGICWGENKLPNSSNGSCRSSNSDSENFTISIDNLEPEQKYFVRAFATNNSGTVYGDDVEFNTAETEAPTVSTQQISSIGETAATSGGVIDSDGGLAITDKGICWNTSGNPSLSDNCGKAGTGSDSFTIRMTNLSPDGRYYVRAFATNSKGTSYGNQRSFTTDTDVTIPTVSTKSISSITPTMAEGGGTVTNSGGAAVTQRGLCWSTSPNPDSSDDCSQDGSGVGEFNSNLRGLSPETTYYVRAYALNSAGVAFGNQVNFTTADADERDNDLSVCETWSVSQSGGAGVTVDNWDISTLPTGVTFDIQFDAYSIPDKFVVEYPIGVEQLDTGWRGSSAYDGDPDYPGGIDGPGHGTVEDIFQKGSVNTFRVVVTGVDEGTAWDYRVRCRN